MITRVKCKEKHLKHLGYFRVKDGWAFYEEFSHPKAERFHWKNGLLHIDGLRNDGYMHYVMNNKQSRQILLKEKERLEGYCKEHREENRSKSRKGVYAKNVTALCKLKLNPEKPKNPTINQKLKSLIEKLKIKCIKDKITS